MFKCQCIQRRVLIGDTFQIELEFRSVGFGGEGKTGVPGENSPAARLSGREPTTNSTHIWRRVRKSIPGHIGGRRVLSLMRHPCSHEVCATRTLSVTSWSSNAHRDDISDQNPFEKNVFSTFTKNLQGVTHELFLFKWKQGKKEEKKNGNYFQLNGNIRDLDRMKVTISVWYKTIFSIWFVFISF